MRMTLQHLVLIILGLWTSTLAVEANHRYASNDERAVELNSIQQLVLRKGAMTTGRRTSPVPQLKCVEGSVCGTQYEPNVIHCMNIGVDYNTGDPSWKCTAELDNGLRLGTTDVVCEGFRDRDDPYVLRGSCGLEYTIHGSPVNSDRSYSTGASWRSHKTYSAYNSASGGSWWTWILGSVFIWLFIRWISSYGDDTNPRAATAGDGGFGPGGFGRYFGGGGGGGGPFRYGGGLGPGYGQADCNNNANNGPGFWPGLLGGAGLGYLFGRNNNAYGQGGGWGWGNRYGYTAPRYGYDGGYGGFAAPPPAPAAAPATQTSTGYGGTRRRG